jgi:dihydroorotase
VNAASESARKLLAAHEELHAHQHRNDLIAVMNAPEGRRFLWQLIGSAGVFQQSFAADPMATAFNEGRRSIGLALLSRLQDESPDLYLKAQGEQIELQRKAQSLREAAEAESAHEQEENE